MPLKFIVRVYGGIPKFYPVVIYGRGGFLEEAGYLGGFTYSQAYQRENAQFIGQMTILEFLPYALVFLQHGVQLAYEIREHPQECMVELRVEGFPLVVDEIIRA